MLFRLLLLLLPAGWLCACGSETEAGRRQAQAANLRLTRTLHSHLNQPDWSGLDTLFAPTVRYRGRFLGETELEVSRTEFLRQYRRMIRPGASGELALRQIYPAGVYHVIVEGIASDTHPARSFCLIYTIEKEHISRVCAY